MTPRMRTLLLGGAVAALAGTVVVLWTPRANTGRADLLDAGLTDDYTPRELACTLLLPDGGYAQRQPIVAVAKVANADGTRDVIFNREDALKVRPYVVDENAGCRVLRTMTWAQVADFDAEAADTPGDCACAPRDAGVCRRIDAGTWPAGWRNEMPPGEWAQDAGCIRKVCGEVYGRSSWPAGCYP